MKQFTIVYDDDERRYFSQIQNPFYIEVSSPCGVFFLTIQEENTDKGLEIEMSLPLDDTTLHIIALEETIFYEEGIELVYVMAERLILKFLKSDDDVLDGNELKCEIMTALVSLAVKTVQNDPSYERYKNHTENVPHNF